MIYTQFLHVCKCDKKRGRKPIECTCFIPRRHKELMTCGDIFGISFPVIIFYGEGNETEMCSSTGVLYKCCCRNKFKYDFGGIKVGQMHLGIRDCSLLVCPQFNPATVCYIPYTCESMYVHIFCGCVEFYTPLPAHLYGLSIRKIYISFQ